MRPYLPPRWPESGNKDVSINLTLNILRDWELLQRSHTVPLNQTGGTTRHTNKTTYTFKIKPIDGK